MTQKPDPGATDSVLVDPTPTISAAAAVPIPTEAPSGPTGGITTASETTPPNPEPGAAPVPSVTAPIAESTPASEPTLPTPQPSAAPVSKATAPTADATLASEPTPTSEPIPAAEPTSTATPANTIPALTPTAVRFDSKEEEEEPQNALTQKFTPAEWKALKEFREKIPAIVADAYSDSPGDKKSTSLDLWGVPIYPDVKDARTSVILMKFLRARNLNPAAAGEMLTATVRWRALFKVEELANEEFPEKIFGSLGHLCGADREGHPVVYNLYGGNQDLKAIFADVQRFLRWRVNLMEQSIAKLDFVTVDQMLQVHDYAGVSMRDRDANSKNATQEATSIFQNHYPEFLSRKFFINVPSLLSWIFWLFKSLVSASTFAKMSVVGSGEHAINKALSEVIDEEEIPKRYGGLAEGF